MTFGLENNLKTAVSGMNKPGAKQEATQRRAVSALAAPGAEPTASDKVLDKLARDLVGQTFFGTLLKQMHESPFKSELFSGGRGEEAFRPMYDQQIAQRMTRGVGEKLVRPIVKKFRKAAEEAYRKQQKEQDLVSTYRRA